MRSSSWASAPTSAESENLVCTWLNTEVKPLCIRLLFKRNKTISAGAMKVSLDFYFKSLPLRPINFTKSHVYFTMTPWTKDFPRVMGDFLLAVCTRTSVHIRFAQSPRLGKVCFLIVAWSTGAESGVRRARGTLEMTTCNLLLWAFLRSFSCFSLKSRVGWFVKIEWKLMVYSEETRKSAIQSMFNQQRNKGAEQNNIQYCLEPR